MKLDCMPVIEQYHYKSLLYSSPFTIYRPFFSFGTPRESYLGNVVEFRVTREDKILLQRILHAEFAVPYVRIDSRHTSHRARYHISSTVDDG